MKILVLVGSYRKNGNTDQITALISDSLRRLAAERGEPLELETIYLGHQHIETCRGCRVCFDRGETFCPLKDDLLAIKARMLAAEGILVASPVYVDDVNGITKNFIDRLAHVCHRPEFAGRSVYLLATVGSSPTSHTLGTLGMAFRMWGFNLAGKSGFKMGALMKRPDSAAAFSAQAARIAQTLYDAVAQQDAARPSFYSLMVFRIQQWVWLRETQTDTVDYRYWHDQGWLEPSRTFYIPHRAGAIKVAAARLVGSAMAPFVAG